MPVVPQLPPDVDPRPEWMRTDTSPSVLDSPLKKALRLIANTLGADNPAALMMPMEVGPSGGLAGVLGKFIKAYHGSPHDFEQFALSKIGTGEGAQAFGHGLYFAENPEVAQQYAQKLTGRGIVTDPQTLQEYFKPGRIVQGYGGPDRVVEFRPPNENGDWAVRVQRVDQLGNPTELPRWHATAPSRMEVNNVLNPGRQGMYEVAIHADPEHLLDWDKPLSQQSQAVQQRLGPSVDYLKTRPLSDTARQKIESGQMTGRDLYWWLSGERSLDQPLPVPVGPETINRIGSEALNEAGIPGIKYLDRSSRSVGQGTRNFVVFDDKLVSILRKYGWTIGALRALSEKAGQQNGHVSVDQIGAVQ